MAATDAPVRLMNIKLDTDGHDQHVNLFLN